MAEKKIDGIGQPYVDEGVGYDAATFGPGASELEAIDAMVGSDLASEAHITATAIQYAAAAICAAIMAGKEEPAAKKRGKIQPDPENE